ncbi:MAG: penicillin-binding protein 2 [Anaerolineae bacterium]|nr:penicillin-binding protein 2 [Anaerolineae bacterium]
MYRRRNEPFRSWRLTVFQVAVVVMFILFAWQAYQYQFVEYDYWLEQAEENRISRQPIAAARGVVEDRYGRTLARNVPAFNVTVVPADLPDPEEREIAVLERLGALLDIPATDDAAIAAGRADERSLYSMVREGEGVAPYRAVTVARDMARDVAMRILEDQVNLPGVDVPYAAVREYPTGALTSQIVGYMVPIPAERQLELMELGYDPNYDRIGLAGVEGYLEDELAGRKGWRVVEVDVAGLPVSVLREDTPIPGRNVRLTLDVDLQQAAQESLVRRIKIVNDDPSMPETHSGVVVAMNPKTGEVLAMVSWPTFDNSRFARTIDADYYFGKLEDPLLPLVNHAVGALYPPGSVWKVLTSNGVLQEKVIHPEAVLRCEGKLVLPNRYAPNDIARAQTFVCWLKEGHEDVDLRRGIAQSCDVYFYQVGGGNPDVPSSVLRTGGLGIDDLVRYAHAFGVGTPSGIEIPGELAGRMPDRDWKRRTYGENWSTGDTYNAAFGQGYVTVTPLQLLNLVAAVANGGTLYRPTVVGEFFDAEGNVLEAFQPRILRTIVRPTDGSLPILTPYEDMLLRGADSLACRCNPYSATYDAPACERLLEHYEASYELDVNPDTEVEEFETVVYTVNTSDPVYIAESICRPDLQKLDYQPPFVDAENIKIIQEGMYQVVTIGTGHSPNDASLPYVTAAGKTGTAEYCDNIAWNLGLCKPGDWPAHAWYVGYAPYEDPEIIIIAFLYNGNEGSAVALPVVREVMDAYFNLKVQRANPTPQPTEAAPPATTP